MTHTLDAEQTIYSVIGYFDGIIDGHAYGWAYIPQSPNTKLTIEIVCNGEIFGIGNADQYRSDLSPAGISDGYHMFNIALSYELYDANEHTLFAREASTGTILSGGSHILGPELGTLPFEPVSRSDGLKILLNHFEKNSPSKRIPSLHNVIKAYNLASVMQECGKLSEAREAWQSIAKSVGKNVLCYCKLGENYLMEADYKAGLQEFKRAAALDLKSYWPHLGISAARRLLGQLLEAEEALKVCIELGTGKIEHENLLAELRAQTLPLRLNALISSNQQNEAIKLAKSHLRSNPDDRVISKRLDELLNIQTAEFSSLPGLDCLPEFERQQRLLNLWLDDAEAVLENSNS